MNGNLIWKAKHFGIYQNLTSKITEFDRPKYFADEIAKGVFKEFAESEKVERTNN